MATTTERVGQRVYLVGLPFAAKDEAKRIGCKWDPDRRQWWIGAAKAASAEALVGRVNAAPPEVTERGPGQTTPTGLPTASERDDRRVLSKVKYRGSHWYVVAASGDGARLMVCKPTGAGHWVDAADCELVKTYHPREYRGRTEYTTLGSIRRFVEKQKRLEAGDAPQCAACGKRSENLTHDLEDGLMKCHACCDMPE
jgi:hypothetical protein